MTDSELTAIFRPLRDVRNNGQAWSVVRQAHAHALAAVKLAGTLPTSIFLSPAAQPSALARAVQNADAQLSAWAKRYDAPSQMAAPISRGDWETTVTKLSALYVAIAGVTATADQPGYLGALATDMGNAVSRYGERLADAGILAPGVVIADAARAVGANVGKAASGVVAGAVSATKPIVDEVPGILAGLWPVLAIGFVALVAYGKAVRVPL